MGVIKFFRAIDDGCLTAYRVLLDGNLIGFVWSRRGFSYRGTEGWNRGIRLRDYHPVEWCCGDAVNFGRRVTFGSRRQAALALVEKTT